MLKGFLKKFLILWVVVLLIGVVLTGCSILSIEPGVSSEENIFQYRETLIDPYSYLATLRFDGTDWWDTGEQNFPQTFVFNTTQDGNEDGVVDTDDALENLVRFKIGNNIYSTGRTGLTNRGPNDQRPAIYFHIASCGVYTVYEYWLYYADNDWVNDHEHDWEKYFIYFEDNLPKYIKLGSHNDFNSYTWDSFPKDNGHPRIRVEGGSHAMNDGDEDGVQIRYSGEIDKRGGRLDEGDGEIIPWVIYSNDNNIGNAVGYSQSPYIFNGGDPEYSTNSDEYGNPSPAPWSRNEWDSPPAP